MEQTLAVGVLATSPKQVDELSRLASGAGFTIAASLDVAAIGDNALPMADAWLVSMDLHEEAAQRLLEQLEDCGAPVIYDDDTPGASTAGANSGEAALLRQQRVRRLAAKLQQLVRDAAGQDGTAAEVNQVPRAQKLWVIAASTGGPDAIAQFLRGIPNDLHGVALLYVQHMEDFGHANLCRVTARNSCWSVQAIDKARVIRENTIYVVSPAQQFELSQAGVISPLAEQWAGRYRPCIDQAMAKVARVFRNRGGAIVFTGMGDDGAASSTLMHHCGGQIWVQQAASCTIDSMPVSVLKKGCVSYIGEPAALAQQFVYFHRHGRLSLASAVGQ